MKISTTKEALVVLSGILPELKKDFKAGGTAGLLTMMDACIRTLLRDRKLPRDIRKILNDLSQKRAVIAELADTAEDFSAQLRAYSEKAA